MKFKEIMNIIETYAKEKDLRFFKKSLENKLDDYIVVEIDDEKYCYSLDWNDDDTPNLYQIEV